MGSVSDPSTTTGDDMVFENTNDLNTGVDPATPATSEGDKASASVSSRDQTEQTTPSTSSQEYCIEIYYFSFHST